MIKQILNLLIQKKNHVTGALIDDRLQEEKEEDIQFGEIVAKADTVFWQTKPESKWRKFKTQNQDGSSSCVGQSARKSLGVMYSVSEQENYIDFSATDIYKRRRNYPKQGMGGKDVLDIMSQGVTLNALVPSDNLSESKMNAVKIANYKKDVGKIFKAGEPVTVTDRKIDTIASIIQRTGKAPILFFYFTAKEWGREKPVILDEKLDLRASKTLKHGVCAVDYTLYTMEKALIIEDSAHFGGISRRIITKEFFDKRCFFAGYNQNFRFAEGTIIKPTFTFTKTLRWSPVFNVNDDVIKLQERLRHEGFFPDIKCSGYYGSITAKAVLAFQKKYKVASNEELNSLKGRVVGPKTIKTLNEFFNS